MIYKTKEIHGPGRIRTAVVEYSGSIGRQMAECFIKSDADKIVAGLNRLEADLTRGTTDTELGKWQDAERIVPRTVSCPAVLGAPYDLSPGKTNE